MIEGMGGTCKPLGSTKMNVKIGEIQFEEDAMVVNKLPLPNVDALLGWSRIQDLGMYIPPIRKSNGRVYLGRSWLKLDSGDSEAGKQTAEMTAVALPTNIQPQRSENEWKERIKRLTKMQWRDKDIWTQEMEELAEKEEKYRRFIKQ